MGTEEEKDLAVDHQKARDHIDDYKEAVTNSFIAQIAILSGAIQDFNKFRDLPEKSSVALAVWDFAFKAISTLVPALKFGQFLDTAQKNAEIGLQVAQIFQKSGGNAARVIKVIEATKAAGQAAKYGDDVKDIMAKAKALTPDVKKPEGHISKGPIKQLIEDLNKAPAVWHKARDAETIEWTKRLYGNADPKDKESLEEKMKKMLTIPEQLDVDEIWKMYLFEMVLAHCKKEVYWEQLINWSNYGYSIDDEKTLKGINGNQKDYIVEWFGPGTKRGTYFKRPIMYNMTWFLKLWPVPTYQYRPGEGPK
jgi:hypothetical protein